MFKSLKDDRFCYFFLISLQAFIYFEPFPKQVMENYNKNHSNKLRETNLKISVKTKILKLKLIL